MSTRNTVARTTIDSDWLAVKHITSLREERTKIGLTCAALGFAIGVSGATIANIERGFSCSAIIYNSLARVFHWELFYPNRPHVSTPAQDENNSQREISFDFPILDETPKNKNNNHQDKAGLKKDATIRLPVEDLEAVKKIAGPGKPFSPVISRAVRFFLAARSSFEEARNDDN